MRPRVLVVSTHVPGTDLRGRGASAGVGCFMGIIPKQDEVNKLIEATKAGVEPEQSCVVERA